MTRRYTYFIIVFLALFLFFRFFIYNKYSSNIVKCTELNLSKATYVGDQSCKNCHGEEHKQWSESHHYMAMLPPNDSTVLGDFNNVVYTQDGVTSRFFKKDNVFVINTQGEDGKNHDYEVKYTFGFKPLQQYLVEFSGGRMQVPRVSWDTQRKKWFHQYAGQQIAAHDWLHWTGNSQNWNTMCASCHSTNLQKNYNNQTDSYKTSFSSLNVSCESCHGGGSLHIKYVSGDDYKNGKKSAGSLIKLPQKTGQTAQINSCAPCHARASEISTKHIESRELMDNYIPEIPSNEHFFADGQVDDEDYIYTSFLQSKMYGKGVKCTDCHNPHSAKLKHIGNQTCFQCHDTQKYAVKAHTFHTSNEATLCVNCHMSGKLYMGNDLRHDHSFRVPRPDLSQKYGTPNACATCHKDKSNQWLADAVSKWYGSKRNYHFSEDLIPGSSLDVNSERHLKNLLTKKQIPSNVQATAAYYLGNIYTPSSVSLLLESLKNKDAQVRYRALRSLSNFPTESWINATGNLLKDKVRAVRIAAAYLYIGLPKSEVPSAIKSDFNSAHKELKEYLLYQTDFAVGNIMLADYYTKLKDYKNAEKFYLRGLKKDDKINYAYLNLSSVYNAQGKNDLALKSLQNALKNDKKNDRIYYNMALLFNEMNNVKEAESCFDKAVALNSKNYRVYYNFGLLLLQNKEINKATVVLNKGILLNPTSSELYYAMVHLYIQTNDLGKAKIAVNRLKQLDPYNPDYQELYKNFGLN